VLVLGGLSGGATRLSAPFFWHEKNKTVTVTNNNALNSSGAIGFII